MDQEQIIDRRSVLALAGAIAASCVVAVASSDASLASRRGTRSSSRKAKKKGKTKKKKSSSGKNGTREKEASRSGTSGDAIVREARKYKGAKYEWAGASPKGFDCSGFTWYVYNQVTGNDIGRTVKEQYKKGTSTSRGALKAGDIVFFKNTFQKGLSHCGIYIAGSDFIHAENETTGVVISSLDSDYYDEHYAGARRLV